MDRKQDRLIEELKALRIWDGGRIIRVLAAVHGR
jgi:hypothetical protein